MAVSEGTSFVAALGRIIWMLFGPLALVVAAFAIVRTGEGWLTTADIAFWVILALMLFGRWLEFRAGNPQTATGEPAKPSDLPRYLVTTAVVGLAIWLLANLAANYWLTSP